MPPYPSSILIPYMKSPKSLEELSDSLTARGLVGEKDSVLELLKSVGYYRLKGYVYRCKEVTDVTPAPFCKPININDLWALYTFDRQLRLITMEAIARVEVWLRACLSSILPTMQNDAFDYCKLFKNSESFYKSCTRDLKHASKSLPIVNFHQKYSDEYPPTWMALEIFTFGTTCQYLTECPGALCGVIAGKLNLKRKVLLNWLQILRSTRNICAHHQRLWDVNIDSQINLTHLKKCPASNDLHELFELYDTDRSFSFSLGANKILRTPICVPLYLCAYIFSRIRPQSSWAQRTVEFLDEHYDLLASVLPPLMHGYQMPGVSDKWYRKMLDF